MDSRSQAPHKSSSFSPATTRDDGGGGRSREVDRNLSVGAVRHDKKDQHHHGSSAGGAGTHREQSIKEEDEGEEEGDCAEDLAALSAEIDAFLAGAHGGDAPPVSDATLERFAAAVERLVARAEGADEDKWAADGDGEQPALLAAITCIAALSSALSKGPAAEAKHAAAAHRVAAVTHRAMAFLEAEFHALLEDPRVPKPADHQGTAAHEHDRCVLPSAPAPAVATDPAGSEAPYPAETVDRLRAVADAMVAAGRAAECEQAFLAARRSAFEAALRGLGYEAAAHDAVGRMAWEALEAEVVAWIKAFRHATNVGLSTEHDLCARVFAGAHGAITVGRAVFADLARCVLLQMLGFTEAVAATKRATEKLFKVLDMYEAVRDAGPVVDAFLLSDSDSDSSGSSALTELKTEIAAARARLCESAAAIFRELESSIRADAGKQPVPGGAVHPLTRYVMNYVKFACAYNATLEQVFREQQAGHHNHHHHHDSNNPDSTSSDNKNPNPNPFAEALVEVMELLHSNLEAKSRLYKDPALRSIFLMNNGRYMLQKIRGSPEVNAMLGESWARRQSTNLRQYHKNYQRETWSRVLGLLRDDGVLTVKGHVQKPVLKERFKQFNAAMDEIQRTQGAWVVSDEQLQSELRVSIAAVVVPAYRSFLGRFAQHFTAGRQTEKYVKLSAEDVEAIIDELFDGNAASMVRRR